MRSAVRPALLRARYELASRLGDHFLLMVLWRKWFRPELLDRLVSDRSDIVIEGFPRTGNTFAFMAFQMSQRRPTLIAHHTHRPSQIAVAVRKKIPTLVIIREPADTVASLVIRLPHLTLGQALRAYIRYYQAVGRFRDGLVVASFREVTTDFGAVIDKVNRRFGTSFDRFEHTPDNVAECFRRIEQRHLERTGRTDIAESNIGRPSDDRSTQNAALREQLRHSRFRPLLDRAQALYDSMTTPDHP